MALKIIEQKGTFFLEGRLNTVTAKNFQTHFEHLLNTIGRVTINIESLVEIDKTGLTALRALYNNALCFNRRFYVVGVGCKEIYEDFKFQDAA